MTNLTSFSSAKKEHLRYIGANTECNKKTSGINVNNLEQFAWLVERYPQNCCKKCLQKYIELISKK